MLALRRLSTHFRSLSTSAPSKVHVNRPLNLTSVAAVGFDMDFTLARYVASTFDPLAFDGAKRKLVSSLGYPSSVSSLHFSSSSHHWNRGLSIDPQRGNFLKVDRHGYVKVASHGFTPLPTAERKALYCETLDVEQAFEERKKRLVNVDTLFQVVDAHLFAHLVEMKESASSTSSSSSSFFKNKSYAELYRDVRACVDLCHRDGVIKDEVRSNPAKYIVKDPDLLAMLLELRSTNKKLFLLTNSLWEYTDVVMSYLLPGTTPSSWLSLFDVVIVGAQKPAFLQDPTLNLFRVDPVTARLSNTDVMYEVPLGAGASAYLSKGNVFQGGNYSHLKRMLGIRKGEDVLYVGDHVLADVELPKEVQGWCTALVVPELEEEGRGGREKGEKNMWGKSPFYCGKVRSAFASRIEKSAFYVNKATDLNGEISGTLAWKGESKMPHEK